MSELTPHFEPHNGIIDGDSDIPPLGRYIDHGGFWADEYILTIDHVVYEPTFEDERPDTYVYINGKPLNEFLTHIKAGSDADTSIGINPKDTVYREPTEKRLSDVQ